MSRILALTTLVFGSMVGQSQAQGLEGDVALSFGRAPYYSTDDDEERLSDAAFKASGWVGTSFGDWRVFGDVNYFKRNIGEEDFDEFAPGGASSIGLHFGRNFGPAYAGAFIGKSRFQGDDADVSNGYLSGKLHGIEAQYDMGNVSVFAQLGRAEMIGEVDDTEFTGKFARIGISAVVDKLTLTVDLEKGNSPDNFEDSGDFGDYRAMGLAVDYQVTNRIIATMSYEAMDIVANSEDSGTDEIFAFGIRIPLGASPGKRNNLTTSYRPALAAAWAETLD